MAERGPAGFVALAAPPTATQLACVRAELCRLVAFQRTLRRFPAPRGLAATPFVSIYAGGRLLGCHGSTEGRPGERLARAFLRAVEDTRFGGVGAEARAALTAQVSYPARLVEVSPGEALASFALGTHGVALALPDGRASVVLPHVARDARLDAAGMIDLAARKAGLAAAQASDLRGSRLWLFETHDAATTSDPPRRGGVPYGETDPLALAARWLASLVDASGAVAFAVDPRTGARARVGDAMHHGRAAVAVAALARSGKAHAAVTARARRRLERDARAALEGKAIDGWPASPAMIAGTLALACLAGAGLERELQLFARAHRREIVAVPWHAAQVVCALGARAAPALLAASARDLRPRPWAPWTALAARKVFDPQTLARAEAALIDSVRARGPHAGGAHVTPVPELALTAIAAEALAGSRSRSAARAVSRARDFLSKWQLVGERLGAAYDPAAARGAFPISPAFDALRCDVTGHALLALLPPTPAS